MKDKILTFLIILFLILVNFSGCIQESDNENIQSSDKPVITENTILDQIILMSQINKKILLYDVSQ